MDALEALCNRHSTRNYSGKAVPRDLLEKILDAGRLATTARNEQPWEFVVVTDSALRAKVADITEYGKFIKDAGACVVVFCKDTKYYLEDGSAATENMLVAAEALGVQSCWVAGDKKDYAPAVAKLLGVPAGFKLISFVALGYEKTPERRAKKRTLAEVVHWEKF